MACMLSVSPDRSWEARLIKLTGKLTSFEEIVRKATHATQKMKESKSKYKADLKVAYVRLSPWEF